MFGLAGRRLASLLALPLVSPFATSLFVDHTGHPDLVSTPSHREFVLQGGSGASVEHAHSTDAAPSGSDTVQAMRAGERIPAINATRLATIASAHRSSLALVRSAWDAVERVAEWKSAFDGGGTTNVILEGRSEIWQNGSSGFEEKYRALEFHWGTTPNWLFFVASAIVLICLDTFILRGLGSSFRAHVGRGMIWLAVAVIYALSVAAMDSPLSATYWVIGYLLEWMLSLDNLLVFHVVFKVYRTPVALQPKALLAGIFGAVVFRFVFFLGLSRLMEAFTVVRVFFGACLIVSGVKVVRGDDDDFDPETSPSVRWLSYFLSGRLDSSYDAAGSFLRYDAKEGRNKLTLLAFVVVVVELTDILFACDSVSAKAGQFSNVYLNLSSSVIAMFGLRSAFFVVKDLIDAFVLLEYGLCTVLVFVGLELCVSPWVDIPPQIGVMVIIAVFVTCIVGSLAMKMRMDGQTREDVSNAP
mmetsp:Transcript_17941/g.49221  ORF Transcript_17941/g.49221 Transcript_17941/m.49221 type:complete len:471 (+) Transcript_17941:41-1453(+)